ncbi:MAG: hypothetical protein AAB942_00900 [Patescibacteria group bacterium]
MDAKIDYHQLWRLLPKWQYTPGQDMNAYNVFWDYPPGFKDTIMPKVFACPLLLDRIVERCQKVLDSGQFDIDKITLFFRQTGFHITVPENACGIDPNYTGDSMCGHNVDHPSQAFSLCFLLLTILDEITQMAALWENNPDTGIEETETNKKWFTLERKKESKPFRLWCVLDFNHEICGNVYARDWEEAKKVANQFYPDEYQSIKLYWPTEPKLFIEATKSRYTILVFTRNGKMHTIKIEAFSDKLAMQEAKQLFNPNCIIKVRIDSCKEISLEQEA